MADNTLHVIRRLRFLCWLPLLISGLTRARQGRIVSAAFLVQQRVMTLATAPTSRASFALCYRMVSSEAIETQFSLLDEVPAIPDGFLYKFLALIKQVMSRTEWAGYRRRHAEHLWFIRCIFASKLSSLVWF